MSDFEGQAAVDAADDETSVGTAVAMDDDYTKPRGWRHGARGKQGMNAEATMMPMTVRQVAEAVQGRLIVPQTGDGVEDGADALATSAVSDSRQVREGSVFVAIAGERVDGHDFVARAGESGAVVALVQHEVDAPVAQIVVPDHGRRAGPAREGEHRRAACGRNAVHPDRHHGSVGKAPPRTSWPPCCPRSAPPWRPSARSTTRSAFL